MMHEGTERWRYWRGLVLEWEESGVTQVEFCGRRRVSLSSFRWWRSRLLREERERLSKTDNAFVPVRVVDSRDPATAHGSCRDSNSDETGSGVEIVVGRKHRVRVSARFDTEVLRRVLIVLEESAC